MLLPLFIAVVALFSCANGARRDYLDSDTKEVLDYFGLDWKALEEKYALPEEIRELISAKAGAQLAEMEAARKLDDDRMKNKIEAAYAADMEKALKTSQTVQKAARVRLEHDLLKGARWEKELVAAETQVKKQLGVIARRVQREKAALYQDTRLSPQDLAAKIKAVEDAGAAEMLKVTDDPKVVKLSEEVQSESKILDRDATDPLKWMAQEQNFIAQEAHYAESMWWHNHNQLKKVEQRKVHEINQMLKKAHVSTPMEFE